MYAFRNVHRTPQLRNLLQTLGSNKQVKAEVKTNTKQAFNKTSFAQLRPIKQVSSSANTVKLEDRASNHVRH